MLFGFIGGSAHAPWAALPADQRRAQVLENLAAFVGDQARAPVDYIEQDWTKERWTRGCPVAHVAPGVLTKYGPWLRRAVGKVHFAGTETVRLLAGLHGRRRALGRARGPGGPRGAAALTPGVCLLRDSFPERPALDIAVSHALLMRVARGELEPTVRLYRPAPTLAFGRLDALRPGLRRGGRRGPRRRLRSPIVRLAGGHAAAYHEQSLIYEEIVAQRDVTAGLHDRFRDAADLLAGALAGLGVETQVGEIAGEYCPGAYTVSAAGRIKLVGSAQRAVRGGALLSAFILVGGGDRLRAVLFDVYRALEIAWRPATAGALDDVAPGVTMRGGRGGGAGRARRGQRADPTRTVDAETLALARTLEERHRWPYDCMTAARQRRAARSRARAPAAWSAPCADRAARAGARAWPRRPMAGPASSAGGHVDGDLARDPAELRAAALGVHGDRVGIVRVVGVAAQHQRAARARRRPRRPAPAAWWRAAPATLDDDQPGGQDLGARRARGSGRTRDRRAGSRRPRPRRRRAGTSSAPRRRRRRPRGPCPQPRPRPALGTIDDAMSRAVEDSNRRLLRARDAMDRSYAQPLDIAALARIALVSEAHFIRTFRDDVRRDAAPLPAAPPRRARDVPARADRPQRHRDLPRRRLREPRARSAGRSAPSSASRPPATARAASPHGRPELLRDGVDATEQFRRSQRARRRN